METRTEERIRRTAADHRGGQGSPVASGPIPPSGQELPAIHVPLCHGRSGSGSGAGRTAALAIGAAAPDPAPQDPGDPGDNGWKLIRILEILAILDLVETFAIFRILAERRW